MLNTIAWTQSNARTQQQTQHEYCPRDRLYPLCFDTIRSSRSLCAFPFNYSSKQAIITTCSASWFPLVNCFLHKRQKHKRFLSVALLACPRNSR